MRRVPLMIIGTAFDGPSLEPYRYSSAGDLGLKFGSIGWECHTLAASTSSITLSSTPWNNMVDITEYSAGDYNKYYLHGLVLSGNSMTFWKPGESKTIYVSYLREHPSGSVVKAAFEALAGMPDELYVMRLPGTKSVTRIGSGDSYITISSRYDGTLYNSMTITAGSTGITIVPPPGMGYTRSYSLNTPKELAKSINYDGAKNWIPVEVDWIGSSTVAPVMSSMSTGSDGTITTSGLSTVLQYADLYGVDVAHIAGMTYEDAKGLFNSAFFDELGYPTVVVQNLSMPASTVEVSAFVSTACTIDTRELHATAQELYYEVFPGVSYWGTMAPAYAAALSKDGISSTRSPINIREFSPRYSAESLSGLASKGIVSMVNTISVGPAVYKGVTTHSTWTIADLKAYQSIYRDLYDALEPIIGSINYSYSQVNTIVGEAMANAPYIKSYSYGINILSDYIVIDIDATVIGEVNSISFQVGVKT